MEKLFRQMSIYGIGGIITKLVQFFLLPIYTRVFSPSDYGALELVYLLGNFAAIIFGLMIRSGYVRHYYTYLHTKERRFLFNSALWFIVASSTLFGGLFYVFTNQVTHVVISYPNGGQLLQLLVLSTVIYVVNQLFYGDLQVREEAKQYILVNISTLAITLILTIYFVVVLEWSIWGVLAARVISGVFELLWLAWKTIQQPLFNISLPLVRTMLTYSIPLIPVQLASFVLELSDRFFLKNYVNLAEVGVYSLAYRISSVLLLFAIEPLRAFTPYIFSLTDNPTKCKQTLADFARYYLLGILTIVLCLSMFAPEVIYLLSSESYYNSWRAVYLISLSYAIYGLSILSSYAIEIVKMNWVSSIFWITAAFCNIGLNFWLIPNYGMLGAALATTLSYLLVLFGYWIATQLLYAIPYQYWQFFYIFLLATTIYLLSTTIHTQWSISVLIKFTLLLLFFCFVVIGGYITRSELGRGKQFLISRRIINLNYQ